MDRHFKPLLLVWTLLGISFGDYLLPNIKNLNIKNLSVQDLSVQDLSIQDLSIQDLSIQDTKQQDRFLVLASNKVSGLQESEVQQTQYQRLMRSLGKLSKQISSDQLLQRVSAQFLGAKYREGLLDKGKSEKLFISLTEFDCVLFIETVLAFSRNLLATKPSYDNFGRNVEMLRYRDGKLADYCSRLHYFSEWVIDNQKRNLVRDLTKDLGGIAIAKKLNFMSSNWQKYPRIKHSEANYQCILAMEKRFAQDTRSRLYYIPSSQISAIYPSLKAGDIIGVVTDLQGLDTTHTGLVYLTEDNRAKGDGLKVGLIHASPSGQVTIAPDLQRYVERVDQAIGIMVVRPNFP